MDITVTPHPLQGTVSARGSKSEAHRALICAALADKPCGIENISSSDDVMSTIECLRSLGNGLTLEENRCLVTPTAFWKKTALFCGESGSTLRFLLPITAAKAGYGAFSGAGRLPERPIKPLLQAMEQAGVGIKGEKLPLSLEGKLKAGEYSLSGSVSSQFVSGLLMALSVVPGESKIVLTSQLQSAPYVSMTVDCLRLFGGQVEETKQGFLIFGKKQLTSPGRCVIGGDWSNAAFFLAADALGGSVKVQDLSSDSRQGDKEILSLLATFQAEGKIHVCLHNIPDLLPILAVLAAFGKETSVFTGGERLRSKESDRLKSTADMLRNLGGKAELKDGTITVFGTGLTGGTVDGAGDHRIVMAAAIAGAYARGPVTITGGEAVKKSYPLFFEDFCRLGGSVHGI